jgi:hypothetical protein
VTDDPNSIADRARQLLAAATPGPWHCFTDDSAGKDQLELWCDYDDGSWQEGMEPPFHLDPFTYDPTPMERATAELIAAAPPLIADLADENERLTAERDDLAARLAALTDELALYERDYKCDEASCECEAADIFVGVLRFKAAAPAVQPPDPKGTK